MTSVKRVNFTETELKNILNLFRPVVEELYNRYKTSEDGNTTLVNFSIFESTFDPHFKAVYIRCNKSDNDMRDYTLQFNINSRSNIIERVDVTKILGNRYKDLCYEDQHVIYKHIIYPKFVNVFYGWKE